MTDDWERTLNEDVPRLAALLHELGVEEIEVSEGGRTVRLRRAAPSVSSAPSEAAAGEAGAAETVEVSGMVTVRAERVGVFHRAAEGEPEPPVAEGDAVEEGQTIGFVDVLGVAHDVLAPDGGVLEQYLVVDGQPVEYGQPLAHLAPQPVGDE